MSDAPELRFYLNDEARRRDLTFQAPRAADAGFDIRSLEDVTIPPGEALLLRTGLHVAIPLDWVGLVRDRSSIALRGGAVTAGVIDSAYRGELKILMQNLSREPLLFRSGERIAQLLVIQHLPGNICKEAETLEALGETDRGEQGFGSTGR